MKKFYDRVYEQRGMFFHKYSQEEGFKKHYEKILELLPAGKTLDIGCGDGFVTSKVHAVGMDFSSIVLRKTKRVYQKLNLICGDSLHIPFKSKAFDVVLLSEVIEHLKEEDAFEMLKEVRRILKFNGTSILSTTNKGSVYFMFFNLPFIRMLRKEGHVKEYTPEELKKKLEIFFKVEKIDFITRTPFIINTPITRLIAILEKPFLLLMPKLFRSWMYFVVSNNES